MDETTFTMTLTKKQAEWVIQQEEKERLIDDLESDMRGINRRLSALEKACVEIADIVKYEHNTQLAVSETEQKYGHFMYSKQTDEGREIGIIDLDILIETITNCIKEK